MIIIMTKVRWVLIAKAVLEVRGLDGIALPSIQLLFFFSVYFICVIWFSVRVRAKESEIDIDLRGRYCFGFLFYYDDPWAHGITFAFFFNPALFAMASNGEPGAWTLQFVLLGGIASLFVSWNAWMESKINSIFLAMN